MKVGIAILCLAALGALVGVRQAGQERRILRLERNQLAVSNVIEDLIDVARDQRESQLEITTNMARALAREIVERREGERR